MKMSGRMMTAAALAVALCNLLVAGKAIEARQPADVAVKLSGSWVLNRELSTGLGPAAPSRGRGGSPSPRVRRSLFAIAPAVQGRRGGGGGGASDPSDLTPEQRAEQAAMRQLQQIADRMTIKASADSVTFIDPRGERTFTVNDKTSTIDLGGSPIKVKSKWDKRVLKQEFSNTQAKLTETWGLDDADHLVLTAKIESLTLVTNDRKAVFDRR
jgi:uncharacterized protein YnzC (UPF0291/DUF896 family)